MFAAARGERWRQLSALLPNVTTSTYAAIRRSTSAEFGFTFKFPGVDHPYRCRALFRISIREPTSRRIFSIGRRLTTLTRHPRTRKSVAIQLYKDARDLVTLAVGYEYLQAVADEARIDTADAQVKTAQSLYDQASDQVKAGTSPAIDGLRAQVEMKTRQQQLIQAKNDFAIQKLALARVIGLGSRPAIRTDR